MNTKIYIIILLNLMLVNCVDIMELTKYICHRIPERSFFIKGHQFPVCARCTGCYSGLIVFLIWNLFFKINYDITTLIISIILMLPVAADGVTQYFGPRESTNNLRFITGFIGGIGLIIFLKIVMRWTLNVLL